MQSLSEKVNRLKGCSTSWVADALVRMGMSGVLEEHTVGSALCGPLNREDSFAGIAVPVLFSIPREGQRTWDLFDLISAHDPGSVFVMSGCGKRCYTGDVYVKYAALEGMSAFAVEGCVRDVQEIARSGMPVFCSGGTTAAKGSGEPRITEYGNPVTFHGIRVCPGDVVVGDADGIIVFPPTLLDAVLEQVEAIRGLEMEYLDVFMHGGDVLERLRAISRKKMSPDGGRG